MTVEEETGGVAFVLEDPENAQSPPVAPPRKRTFLGRFRVKLRRLYKKLGLKHVASLGIVLLYTLIGGLAFLALEYDNDYQESVKVYQNYSLLPVRLFDTVINCTKNSTLANETDCLNLIKVVIDDYRRLATNQEPPENRTKWDIWNSIYFACTIYTTIGYGDIYCKTVPGRLFTMLYALIGIPLLLTTLNDLGKAMFNVIHRLITYNEMCTGFLKSLYQRYLAPRKALLFRKRNESAVSDVEKSSVRYRVVSEPETSDKADPPVVSATDVGDRELRVDFDTEPKETGSDPPEEDRRPSQLTDATEGKGESAGDEEKEIPVWLALVVTIGWIFGCAAVFVIWEDKWSYFGSVYFFFISLTTIGLGDVTPEHPKYMIIAYGLVIIGLSLVSMCINVIQRKLETLYYQLLQMILDEYTKQLSTGSNQLNATMGMMRMWNHNTKAKFLVPLLSKDKKQSVAQKFQEEKEAQGIALPPVLKQMDKSTGMPVMFSVAKQEELEEPEFFEVAVLESLHKAETVDVARKDSIPDVTTCEAEVENKIPAVLYDATTETEKVLVEDKHEQTVIVEWFDEQIQTDDGAANLLQVEEASQTTVVEHDEADAQTAHVETREDECQTSSATKKEANIQTLKILSQDQELQTHLYDLMEQELQTDPPCTKNQRIQTPIPEMADFGVQTEPEKAARRVSIKGAGHSGGHGGFAANARKKLKKAFKAKSKDKSSLPADIKATPSQPSMATWADIEGDEMESELGADEDVDEEEDEEDVDKDLEWDPIDGMHAEKQKKVHDLKRMFEQKRPETKYY